MLMLAAPSKLNCRERATKAAAENGTSAARKAVLMWASAAALVVVSGALGARSQARRRDGAA